MYDEFTRIPFIVKWPAVAPEGAVCSHLVSHINVSGTVVDYFGHRVPNTMEGTSMLSTFRDPAIAPHTEVFIEWRRYEVDHDGLGQYCSLR